MGFSCPVVSLSETEFDTLVLHLVLSSCSGDPSMSVTDPSCMALTSFTSNKPHQHVLSLDVFPCLLNLPLFKSNPNLQTHTSVSLIQPPQHNTLFLAVTGAAVTVLQ